MEKRILKMFEDYLEQIPQVKKKEVKINSLNH